MKTQKYAKPAPGRSAAEHRNVQRDGEKNCRRPERYRYAIHPPIPTPCELSRAESLCIAGNLAIWGTVTTSPMWWEYDSLPVLRYMVVAAAGIYCVLRMCAEAPKLIREIRKRIRRGIPVWLTPVYHTRERDTFGGYIPRDVICQAARGARK